MFNPEAELIVIINGKDEDGFPTEETIRYPVLVLEEKSVTYAEKYLAANRGAMSSTRVMVEPRIILVIRQEDWEETARVNEATSKKEYATQIAYDGAIWDIIRDFRRNRSTVELTCG